MECFSSLLCRRMKIYLSGIISKQKRCNLCWDFSCEYWLVAFPELKGVKNIDEKIGFIKDRFLDSWWYSIRIRWLELSVVDYANFINKYPNYFNVIANMDTSSVEETISNQKFLESETKQKILPVYHRSDIKEWNIKLLEKYCEEYDYIALWWVAWLWLSPRQKEYYLWKSFQIAMKHKTKIHWFGITSLNALVRYPFYSVDSTSWLQQEKYNQFTIFNNGKWYKYTAREYREKYWLDPGKKPTYRKTWESKKQWEKFNDYITKLHIAKWMEYWN